MRHCVCRCLKWLSSKWGVENFSLTKILRKRMTIGQKLQEMKLTLFCSVLFVEVPENIRIMVLSLVHGFIKRNLYMNIPHKEYFNLNTFQHNLYFRSPLYLKLSSGECDVEFPESTSPPSSKLSTANCGYLQIPHIWINPDTTYIQHIYMWNPLLLEFQVYIAQMQLSTAHGLLQNPLCGQGKGQSKNLNWKKLWRTNWKCYFA